MNFWKMPVTVPSIQNNSTSEKWPPRLITVWKNEPRVGRFGIKTLPNNRPRSTGYACMVYLKFLSLLLCKGWHKESQTLAHPLLNIRLWTESRFLALKFYHKAVQKFSILWCQASQLRFHHTIDDTAVWYKQYWQCKVPDELPANQIWKFAFFWGVGISPCRDPVEIRRKIGYPHKLRKVWPLRTVYQNFMTCSL